MGLAESALILLGIGIVSSRFKAGTGLGELGTGISTLVAAPLVGTGTGLSTFAGGLRDVFETFGDLGRGLGALFENIPKIEPGFGGGGGGARTILPEPSPPPVFRLTQPLIPDSGGSTKTMLAGGGGNVRPGPDVNIAPVPQPPIISRPPNIDPRPTQIYSARRPVMM